MSFAGLVWPGGLANQSSIPTADELMELDERIMTLDGSLTTDEAAIAALEAANLRGMARFIVNSGTVANNDWYSLTLDEREEFSDGFPLIEANAITGGGNSIRIANTSARFVGWWRVSIDICEIDIDGDSATAVEVYRFNRSSSSDPTSGAIVKEWDTTKRTGGGPTVRLTGEYLFKIAPGSGDVGLAFRVDAPVAGHAIPGSVNPRALVTIEQTLRRPP